MLLKDIDLEIRPGETHVLFGPNGSGKTSLLMTIMGYPQYVVRKGKITFKGTDITHAPLNERAALGIGMSYQRSPTINGLKTRQMIDICARKKVDVEEMARSLNFEDFLDRDVNAGFSGGEIKRSELLQLKAQGPDLMLFDDPNPASTSRTWPLSETDSPRSFRRSPESGERPNPVARQWKERTRWGSSSPHGVYPRLRPGGQGPGPLQWSSGLCGQSP
jgi:Fe-S cluster assembly ATP-binding protein